MSPAAFADNPQQERDIAQPDSNFHIYLCFGQSNMEGAAAIEDIDKIGVDERFQVMSVCDVDQGINRTPGEWYTAIPPLCRAGTGLCPADYFGRTMVEYLPDSCRVGVIVVAMGGSGIDAFGKESYADYYATTDDWQRSLMDLYDGNPYRKMVTMAKKAQKEGVIKGILLHQGETNNTQGDWPQKVQNIYNESAGGAPFSNWEGFTFGDESPIGKELTLDKQDVLTVRGVYRDMPQNTFLGHYDFVASVHANGGYVNGNGWRGNDMFNAILRLRRAGDVEAVNDRIQQVIERHTSTSWDGWKSTYSVIPLPDLHTDYPDIRRRLAILGFLGFALFFVAAMNYILISIATLSRRAKAVGVHKCNGAGEGQVFTMFMLETGAMVLAAAVLSALLLWLFAGGIESWLGTPLASLFTWQTLWVPLLTMLLLFLVAGVLPGRMFARIPVTQVFRRYTDGKKGWKRGLLAVQFAGVSFVLGLLLVTAMQYTMLIHADMGFRIPGLVQAENWMDGEQGESVCDYIRRQPYVEGVTTAANGILWDYWTQGLIDNSGKRIATLNWNPCGKDYVQVTGIHVIEGRAPEKEGETLVNEELVRLMGWTDGAVGKRLNAFYPFGKDGKDAPIVGVFRDVRNSGFANRQNPIALVCGYVYHAFNVRLKEPYDDNLKQLNAFMKEAFPDVGLHFVSVDELHRNMYWDVSRFRNSVMLTSLFIVLIVLMGLIGYVNDETGRRAKEIAIRKVNGASAADILRLLSRGVLLIAVPCVAVGTGVAWYVGTEWLTQFAGQVSISPWHFVGLAVLLLVVIVCIVVLKAWHIAGENPVESIKAE